MPGKHKKAPVQIARRFFCVRFRGRSEGAAAD